VLDQRTDPEILEEVAGTGLAHGAASGRVVVTYLCCMSAVQA